MPLDIQLRRRSEIDLEFFVELFSEMKNSELSLEMLPEKVKDQIISMQFHGFERSIYANYPNLIDEVIIYISKKAGRLLLHKDENSIRIINISLLNDFRNLGIGSAILRDIVEEANKTRKSILLEVDKINPAMHLYARLGFKIIEENELKYAMKYHCSKAIKYI